MRHTTSRLASSALLLALLGGAAAPALAATPAALQQKAVERYVLAGATGAKLLNLPDPKGLSVLQAEAGTPLAVVGTKTAGRVEYLEVQAPGGLKVWLYGQYVKPSERVGWVELTGSQVNLRPLPRSQNSWAVGRVDKGERLLMIQRGDASKSLAEDWVQVWSPATTTAYVLAAETTALPEGQDGAKLWDAWAAQRASERVSSARAETPAAPQAVPADEVSTTEAAASGQGAEPSTLGADAPKDAFEALRRADDLMAVEMAKTAPDFAAVIAAYDLVLSLGPDAPTRSLVERHKGEVQLRRDFADIKTQAAQERAAREREIAELRAKIASLSKENDPLWGGRFDARGWLEAETVKGQRIYRIRFGSETVAEVQCLSGRYDLDQYVDFELGIQGKSIGSATRANGSLPVIDIERVIVISARLGR
ncbi:MAG: hypothetical protein H6828_11200 [Planctomycetes bacterium]|nr:hypothetical protein [Planctomycetota bacterium]